MNSRNAFGWLTVVTTAALAIAGATLGVMATAVPNPLVGGNHQNIRVSVDRPDVDIEFTWSLDATGDVTMFAGILGPSPEQVVIYVVLKCDARLKTVESYSDETVSALGDADKCADGSVFESGGAAQVIALPVGQAELAIAKGRPEKPWTSSGAGQRVARAPQIFFGFQSAGITDEFALFDPGPSSTLRVSLDATVTEALSIYVPSEATGTNIETSASIFDAGNGVPSVAGSVVWSRSGGAGNGLQQAYSRWDDSAATSAAQLQLLLSGVFLGVAASLIVEALFSRARPRAVMGKTKKVPPSPNDASNEEAQPLDG